MKLVKRLQPDQGELDRMFSVMRFLKKVARGIGFGHEGVDQFGRTGRASQGSEVIAAVEIPFQVRAVSNPEDEISLRQRNFEQRTKSSGVSGQADTKIDVRRDDA